MPDFGEIKSVPIRQLWPNEAHDFTPWLSENIAALGAVLGMDLEVVTTEADVGDFSLDLLAKDLGSGQKIVIENQFGPTDHNHLGKLLTYAAGLDAGSIVWVAEEIRDEHRQALEWFNRRTDAQTHAYGIVVEVFQIDTSKPAFSFRPVVIPAEAPDGPGGPAEPSARGDAYRRFFQALIDELRQEHHFTKARVAQPQNWYSFASGVSGVSYGASFALGGRVRVDLYISTGETDRNKAIFDQLRSQQSQIEADFGEPLEWERLDERRASRVALYRPGAIDADDETLEQLRMWAVQTLLRFRKVFSGRLLRTQP